MRMTLESNLRPCWWMLSCACLVSALASPQRTIKEGQSDSQQLMENKIAETPFLRIATDFPSKEGCSFTHPTCLLLLEAQRRLHSLTNQRERRHWVDTFLNRIRRLVLTLDRRSTEDVANEKQTIGKHLDPNDFNSTTVKSTALLLRSLTSEKPIIPLQEKQAPDYHSAINEIDLRTTNSAEPHDELKRELEDLQLETAQPPKNIFPKRNTQTQESTDLLKRNSEFDLKRIRPLLSIPLTMNTERDRLGGKKDKMLYTSHQAGSRFSSNVISPLFSRTPIEEFLAHKNLPYTMNKGFKDMDSDGTFSPYFNPKTLKPAKEESTSHSLLQPQNNSFQSINLNLPPNNQQQFLQQLSRNLAKAYSIHQHRRNDEIKSMILKLKRQRHTFQSANKPDITEIHDGIERHPYTEHITAAQNNVADSQLSNKEVLSSMSVPELIHHHSHFLDRNLSFTPSEQWSETLPSPDTEDEFSDEIKRQLRDGKVIILSDSVVHTNFENSSHKKKR